MWQHLSRLKASAFFSLQKFFSFYETQQLILGSGTAIWWVTEPHCIAQGGQGKHNHCLIVIIHLVLISVAKIQKIEKYFFNVFANLNQLFGSTLKRKNLKDSKLRYNT
jgi:hypothetical protein